MCNISKNAQKQNIHKILKTNTALKKMVIEQVSSD